MSGEWKRSMVEMVGHPRTKGRATGENKPRPKPPRSGSPGWFPTPSPHRSVHAQLRHSALQTRNSPLASRPRPCHAIRRCPVEMVSEVVNHLYDSCLTGPGVHVFDAPNESQVCAGARWEDSGRNSGGRGRFFHILSGVVDRGWPRLLVNRGRAAMRGQGNAVRKDLVRLRRSG